MNLFQPNGHAVSKPLRRLGKGRFKMWDNVIKPSFILSRFVEHSGEQMTDQVE